MREQALPYNKFRLEISLDGKPGSPWDIFAGGFAWQGRHSGLVSFIINPL